MGIGILRGLWSFFFFLSYLSHPVSPNSRLVPQTSATCFIDCWHLPSTGHLRKGVSVQTTGAAVDNMLFQFFAVQIRVTGVILLIRRHWARRKAVIALFSVLKEISVLKDLTFTTKHRIAWKWQMNLKIHNRNCCAVSANIWVKCKYLIFGTMPVCCVLTLLKVALISVFRLVVLRLRMRSFVGNGASRVKWVGAKINRIQI